MRFKTGMTATVAFMLAGSGWAQTSITTDGDVEAQGFKGDGSQLTNVTAVSAATADFATSAASAATADFATSAASAATADFATSAGDAAAATQAANSDKLDDLDSTDFALDSELQTVAADLAALQLQVSALGMAPVPRTGQTISFAGGDDGDLRLGVTWPNPRFTVNESSPGVPDGTVTDNLTGLIWLTDADCFGVQSWSDALTLANGLADGDCGLTDGSLPGEWRLPNVQEIDSLLHFGVFDPTLPDTTGTGQWASGDPFVNVRFAGVFGDFYWTSTTLGASLIAYLQDMRSGVRDAGGKTDPHPLWPVKGGQ